MNKKNRIKARGTADKPLPDDGAAADNRVCGGNGTVYLRV